MVLTLFALPLLLMSVIYLRIFIIISRHQRSRQLNHERSTLMRGVMSATGPTGTAAAVNLPELIVAKNDASSVALTNMTATSSFYEPQRRHIHSAAVPQTNTKALITTLLILGTYFISYVPAIIYQVLTCIDHCPYPLYELSYSRRVLLGAMTTLLLVAKSVIDPFIYSYRMSEIQVAIGRYLSKRKSKSSFATSRQASQRYNNNNNNNNTNVNIQINKAYSSNKI